MDGVVKAIHLRNNDRQRIKALRENDSLKSELQIKEIELGTLNNEAVIDDYTITLSNDQLDGLLTDPTEANRSPQGNK